MKRLDTLTVNKGHTHAVNTISKEHEIYVTACGVVVRFGDKVTVRFRQKPEKITCKNCLRGH